MKRKIEYLIKHDPIVQALYVKLGSFGMRFIGSFTGMDEKLVLLSSMSGDQYTGSPKVLFEKMKEDPVFKDYRYVWAFKDPSKFEVKGADKIKIDTLSYFKVALRSKIWITDVNIERGLHFKKKKTVYLNTWHGTGPKKGARAVSGRKDYDFSCVDIMCCDGDYTKKVFKKYWLVKEENMLMCGRPREDRLFELNEDDRADIKKRLGIPENKKVILYMPTWRENGIKPMDWNMWCSKLGEEYVILVRQHHFSHEDILKEGMDGFLIDCSGYPDVNDLYWVSDVLISDYSSAFFDFGLLGKPMFCYAYDYDEYIKYPGLFIDLKNEFPNGVFEEEAPLIEKISSMDYPGECEKIKDYCSKYVSHPVNATECCIDRLQKLVGDR